VGGSPVPHDARQTPINGNGKRPFHPASRPSITERKNEERANERRREIEDSHRKQRDDQERRDLSEKDDMQR
jgi:hypothetical protein